MLSKQFNYFRIIFIKIDFFYLKRNIGPAPTGRCAMQLASLLGPAAKKATPFGSCFFTLVCGYRHTASHRSGK
jgi:hypothetical protein